MRNGNSGQTRGPGKLANQPTFSVTGPLVKGGPIVKGMQPAFNGEAIDKRLLLRVLSDFKKGNFSVRMPDELTGIDGKIADALNDIIELNGRMATELERVSQVVGVAGRINQRASLGNVSGAWAASMTSVNNLIGDLVHPTS